MTPQLQQAIRLLQLPTLELRQEIQQALESNLMLEAAEEDDAVYDEAELHADGSERQDDESAGESAETDAEADGGDGAEDYSSERLSEDPPVDSTWEDLYDGSTSYSAPATDDEWDPLQNQSSGGDSLQDYLLWQIQLSGLTDRDLGIAETIIDTVSDDGYLTSTLEEIVASLPPEWELEVDDVAAVLAFVQRLDPVGVAARSPREALLIQLEQLHPDTPWLNEARQLVDRYLDMLVNRQYAQLKRRMRLETEDLQHIIALIQTLDPRPGARISNQRTEYIVPDVFVRRFDGVWQVEINPDAYPRLRINSYYAGLVRRADNSRDNNLMREHLQEARWLIKSLRSRNDTLLKVAQSIVERQSEFLEHGEVGMKPLVLREVAEAIGMHESTVSRITNSKYMRTPRGTFEFKYFFSSHVQTADGGECSATAIRARIRSLIAEEKPSSPLSDSKLAEILKAEGINVARRTVAKYREAMTIASSTERKRLA